MALFGLCQALFQAGAVGFHLCDPVRHAEGAISLAGGTDLALGGGEVAG